MDRYTLTWHSLSRRPRIGVTTGRYHGRTVRLASSLAILMSGGIPVRIGPGLRTRLDGLDGLIIGGGVDIESRLYGVDTTDEWPFDPDRDSLELGALDWADRHGLPVLGICRGAQLINVHRGGTLIRDIDQSHPGRRRRRSVLPCRTVTLTPRSRLAELVGPQPLRINALHHQAVDRLGSGMTVAAVDGDGIVQAVEADGPCFRVGVQWHPELLAWKSRHRCLFAALVAAARDSRRQA